MNYSGASIGKVGLILGLSVSKRRSFDAAHQKCATLEYGVFGTKADWDRAGTEQCFVPFFQEGQDAFPSLPTTLSSQQPKNGNQESNTVSLSAWLSSPFPDGL